MSAADSRANLQAVERPSRPRPALAARAGLVVLLACGCARHGRVQPAARPLPQDCLTTVGLREESDPPAASVSWWWPEGRERQGPLSRWCQAVGPVVFHPVPSRPATLGPEDELLVVTWNVRVGAAELPGLLRNLGVDCRLRSAARQDPTRVGSGIGAPLPLVVLVQEALGRYPTIPTGAETRSAGARFARRITAPPPLYEIRDVVEDCGLSLLYAPSMRNGANRGSEPPEDRGNAIISTLPLRDPHAVELPFEMQRRVAVVATVPGPEGDDVRFVSLHFDTVARLSSMLLEGDAVGRRQARGVLGALRQLDAENRVAAVAGGDLNTSSHRHTAIRTLEAFFRDSPPADGRVTKPSTGVPADHLFFRQGTGSSVRLVPGSYRRLDSAWGSDHYPRALRLRWTEGADAAPGHPARPPEL